MPVEEYGNMLLCLGALATAEGNADFASRWWPVVTRWAEFLRKIGFDPDNLASRVLSRLRIVAAREKKYRMDNTGWSKRLRQSKSRVKNPTVNGCTHA